MEIATRSALTVAEHANAFDAPSTDCPDCLLEVRDAAELLNCSEKWVYRHYRELPHILIGTGEKPRLRFRRKAILSWIEQHEIDWRKKR